MNNSIKEAQNRKERNRFKLAAEKVCTSNPNSRITVFYTKKPTKDIANGEEADNKVTKEMFDLALGKVLENQNSAVNRAVRDRMEETKVN